MTKSGIYHDCYAFFFKSTIYYIRHIGRLWYIKTQTTCRGKEEKKRKKKRKGMIHKKKKNRKGRTH